MLDAWIRRLSAALLLGAVAATAVMLVYDGLNRLGDTPIHRRASALALIFVGLSFAALQLKTRASVREKIKRMLLGLAFILWGSEQFAPPSAFVTAMDSLVILIFVADLGLVIADQLRDRSQ